MTVNDYGHIILTREEKEQCRETGRLQCPNGHEMTLLGAKRMEGVPYKPEFYCSSCHQSAPCW